MSNQLKRYLATHISSLAALFICLTTAIAAQTGVARDAFKGSGELRDRAVQTAESIDEYVSELEKVDRSLSELSRSHGSLQKNYKSFSKNLRSLEKAQSRVVKDIDRTTSTRTDYFTAWEKANIQISDPDLRQASAARRSQTMTSYQMVADRIDQIGSYLPPLMNRLHDVDNYLATDLTRSDVSRAAGAIQSCRAEIQELKTNIADVQAMLKQFVNEAPK